MSNLTRRLGTVRVRLTLWYIAMLVLTVLGFFLYLELELEASLSEQIDAGLQVAASQVLVQVDVSVDPPVLRPMSEVVVDQLVQSRSAMRLVNADGAIVAEMGNFPYDIPVSPDLQSFETVTLDGTTWRIYTQRVVTPTQQLDTWLQVGQSLIDLYETRSSLLHLLVIGVPLTLIVASLGGLFMAARALRPVDAITRTVQEINATDMTKRVEVRATQDELGRLTQTFNSMLDRLQTGFERERRFTADASHELRTPLHSIKVQTSLALSHERSAGEYIATLEHVQLETDRLTRLVNDLLLLARLDSQPDISTTERINLSDLLAAVVDQMSLIADTKQIQITMDVADALLVPGRADHLIRLFLNILDNALKFTAEGGEIRLKAEQAAANVVVSVQDSGKGIPPEHLIHLFDRFYRAETDRKYDGGAGLGLAIVQQIARQHGGMVSIQSTVGEGTTVTVYLPAAL
jgi:heavy metal sensor kinase